MIRNVALIALCCAIASPAYAEDDEVARIMARFDNEPSIRDVQKAAIDYYNVSPDTIRSLRSRARKKALLPGLSVGGSTYRLSSALSVDDIVYRAVGIARFEDQNGVYVGATQLDLPTRVTYRLRIDQLEALIDLTSGGYLSRWYKRHRRQAR